MLSANGLLHHDSVLSILSILLHVFSIMPVAYKREGGNKIHARRSGIVLPHGIVGRIPWCRITPS